MILLFKCDSLKAPHSVESSQIASIEALTATTCMITLKTGHKITSHMTAQSASKYWWAAERPKPRKQLYAKDSTPGRRLITREVRS